MRKKTEIVAGVEVQKDKMRLTVRALKKKVRVCRSSEVAKE